MSTAVNRAHANKDQASNLRNCARITPTSHSIHTSAVHAAPSSTFFRLWVQQSLHQSTSRDCGQRCASICGTSSNQSKRMSRPSGMHRSICTSTPSATVPRGRDSWRATCTQQVTADVLHCRLHDSGGDTRCRHPETYCLVSLQLFVQLTIA